MASAQRNIITSSKHINIIIIIIITSVPTSHAAVSLRYFHSDWGRFYATFERANDTVTTTKSESKSHAHQDFTRYLGPTEALVEP